MDIKNKKLISVVIPCHNYANYLPDAVGSVLAQTWTNWEIIIVNDGSTDNSRKIAEKLIDSHRNRIIRLINQENSGHPAHSRNRGIAAARGDFILPLDADDMIAPTMLSECLAVLERDDTISIVYTDRLDYDGVEQVVLAGDYDFNKLKYANHISYCALFRRTVWEDVGGYRAVGYEDWDFWVAAGALGYYGYRISSPLFKYRRHDTGRFQIDSSNNELLTAEIVLRNHSIYSSKDIRGAIKIVEKLGGAGNKALTAYRQSKNIGWLRRIISTAFGKSDCIAKVARNGKLIKMQEIACFENIIKIGRNILEIPKDMAWCFSGNEYYEKNVFFWLNKLVKILEMPVVYDIGANYGVYSLSFCEEARHIFAFEPVTSTYYVLMRNIQRNMISNVSAFKLGISDSDGQEEINIYSSSGNNSIFKRSLPKGHPLCHIGKETIQVTSLDVIIEKEVLLPPDIIKIDVEGAELFVLRGARKTLARHKPLIILEYAETTSADAGYSAATILEELTHQGYVICGLSDDVNDQTLYPMTQFAEIDIANIIAFSEENPSHAHILRC